LSRLEGDRSLTATLAAGGHGLGFREITSAPARALALSLTILTALRLILKILIVEEVLFSRCENEICSAIDALEDAVLKFRHTRLVTNLNVEFGPAGPEDPAAILDLLDFPA
jgi:hypothetical protein